MGKGSNVAKANAARARNAKEQGKSKEEREASKAKAEKDRNAKKCLVCLQTFMISSKDKLLYDHVVAKHDKLIKEPEKCFPHLKGFDPNAPEPTGIAVAQAAAKKKVKKVRLRRLRLDPRAPPARLTALYPHAGRRLLRCEVYRPSERRGRDRVPHKDRARGRRGTKGAGARRDAAGPAAGGPSAGVNKFVIVKRPPGRWDSFV